MTNSNEAFSRVVIDGQLADQGWNTQDQNSVRYEYVLQDGTRADYVLCDRYGRSMAVIGAFQLHASQNMIRLSSTNSNSAASRSNGTTRTPGKKELGTRWCANGFSKR